MQVSRHVLAIAIAATLAFEVEAIEIHVPADYPTIQEAIDAAAQAGDEVIVAPGTYIESVYLRGKEIYLHSSGGPELTNIDATDLRVTALHCINGEGPETIIEGISFKTKWVRDAGGGILINNSSPTVRNCIFRNGNTWYGGVGMSIEYSNAVVEDCLFINNETEDWFPGGAILVVGGRPTIRDCEFIGNVSDEDDGGAIAIRYEGDAVIVDCLFLDNSAGYGGAIHVGITSSATIERCMFLDNYGGWGWGGAIACDEAADLVIKDCAFVQNDGTNSGGAIYAWNTNLIELVNCLFLGNGGNSLHYTRGGAIRLRGNSNATVTNCTLAENTAELGGGIYVSDNSHIVVSNSILWDNSAEDGGDEVFMADESCTVNSQYSDIRGSGGSGPNWNDLMGTDGGGNIDADPMFANPSNYNLRLRPGSSCIDAGNNETLPPNIKGDLDGNVRFIDSPYITDTGQGEAPIVDMGCYEFQALTHPTLQTQPDPLIAGKRALITISGSRNKEITVLAYSLKGAGNFFIPPLNVALDLRSPKLAVTPKKADSDGYVEWIVRIPPDTTGLDVWFQAVQMNLKTNVVETRVE